MQKALKSFDFSKPLMWDLPECLDQFHQLVSTPPLHSVVVQIEPAMAKVILKASNDRNRPLNRGATWGVQAEIESGQFELTGDTLKVSSRGRLIDGQHRLEACVLAGKGFVTHVVFGLNERVFDVLDRQRTRTAADILAIGGTKEATIVAGATRWAKIISERRRGYLGGTGSRAGKKKPSRTPSPRETRELVAGPMRALPQYTRDAAAINKAYKIPPTLACGLLWCIGQSDKVAAEGFTKDWLHGNRNYTRNQNFDALSSRIASVKAQSNGHLNRIVLAAMIVQTFNHWHANIAATPRALTWKREWAFPALAFDKAAFLRSRQEHKMSDTSLQGSQIRALEALIALANGAQKVAASQADIAKKANVNERYVPEVIRSLIAAGKVYIDKKGKPGPNTPTVYRIEATEAA